jgi:hypothetical protein
VHASGLALTSGPGTSATEGGCTDRAGPAPGDAGADRRARGAGRACAKRYPAIWAVRSRSDGGDQTGGAERLWAAPLLSTAVKSPELGQARARVVPGSLGLGREGENDTANSVAGK